ncbi:MAG: hypothetical protein K2H41_12465 [Acetatifactor sp.]|nr:hypothetical protein [Acetatifactor sp.]
MTNEAVCMDIRSFAEMVSRAVSEELGESCQVKLQEIMKNNGVILQGLVILTGKKNLSPTIYLNSFLEAYAAGIPLTAIVSKILEIYRSDMPAGNIDMNFFREFDRVRSGICYRVVNRKRNRVLLERIPHIDFLDLSICFFYAYQSDVLGSGSILIYNSHMEMWNCSTETLMQLAQDNTERLYPWEVHRMEDLLSEALPWEEQETGGLSSGEEDEAEGVPMRVLCNTQRIYGATCMIYPGVLHALAEEAGENLYILPSSVHEILLMPESEVDDTKYLQDMIREVNSTQVEPEEILSDNLYYYNRLEKRVEIVDCK